MLSLASLWLPILLSAVAVFVVSSILHMATPWHKGDYKKLANEDQLLDAVRAMNIPPGDYMMPMPASREEMRSPAFQEKAKRGPAGQFILWPSGSFSMGRNLGLWFANAVVVSAFAGHIAAAALGTNADKRFVFHTVGLTAFLGYAAGLWQMSIWYRRSWLTTFKLTVDGLIYGAVTALIFVWLWT